MQALNMFTISKTTHNMATKRGIELLQDDSSVSFYKISDDSEPMFIYSIENGGLFFKGNIWLDQQIKEELPHWIAGEQQLKQVIRFLGEVTQ